MAECQIPESLDELINSHGRVVALDLAVEEIRKGKQEVDRLRMVAADRQAVVDVWQEVVCYIQGLE